MLEIVSSEKQLQILRLLSGNDLYVSQIMEELGIDGKNSKRHLDTLEKSGIVESYRDGRRKYYSLDSKIRLEIVPPSERNFLLFTTEGDATEIG